MSYVLVERQGNYNDEIMYMEESDGGVPVRVLHYEDDAIEHLNSATKERFRGFKIGAWCYCPQDIDLPKSEEDRAELQIFGEECDMTISKDVTDENLDKIVAMIGTEIEFFQLFKIDDETGKVTIYNKIRKIFQ